MIQQIWGRIVACLDWIGELLFENYEIVNGVAMILFALAMLVGLIISISLEKDLGEITERVEKLEKRNKCEMEE